MNLSLLQCPLCTTEMTTTSSGLACSNNHHFDQAKQGYYNLLPVQHKASKQPGDDKLMVRARHEFLEANHYLPFSQALNTLLLDHLDIQTGHILDAGCGEGYYLQQLADNIDKTERTISLTGIDISKHAIQTACKRSRHHLWLVASAANAPLKNHSMDVIYSLFAPLNAMELHRLLKPEGVVIIASAGSKHLLELREQLYDDVKSTSIDTQQLLSSHFDHQTQQTVDFEISLDSSEAIQSLLKMTPHYWRAKADAKKQLATLDQLCIKAQINLDIFAPKTLSHED